MLLLSRQPVKILLALLPGERPRAACRFGRPAGNIPREASPRFAFSILNFAILCLALLSPISAADPSPRKTLRIAGAWNLTATHHEHTKKEGTRVKLLTSTGKPTLKHGPNPIRGPWDVEATAETIQCDFEGKKFILSGISSVVAKDKGGNTEREIIGKAGATIEINFADLAIEAKGPTVTKIRDLAPAAPAPVPAAPEK